jgi:Zn-dependent peptidase ImmA (M78 family)
VSRFAYYEQMKILARQVRQEYGLASPRVLRSDLRRLYRAYGIKIDLWPHKFKGLRGAYFDDDLGPTVVLARQLPPEPLIFTMAHELKHHLVDRGLGLSYCDAANQREPLEIGAEVFAAELIFPEQDFRLCLKQMGVGPRQCTPEALIRLKRETQTTLSYAGLAKRAEFLNFAPAGSLARVAWKKLEEQLYGEPLYKRLLHSRQADRPGTRS